jgi:hypothetical protein
VYLTKKKQKLKAELFLCSIKHHDIMYRGMEVKLDAYIEVSGYRRSLAEPSDTNILPWIPWGLAGRQAEI